MANCKTSKIVYLIECRKCKKTICRGNGESLHLRINGHWSNYYRQLSDKPVAEHFNTIRHSFDDITVMVIEQLHVVADSVRR